MLARFLLLPFLFLSLHAHASQDSTRLDAELIETVRSLRAELQLVKYRLQDLSAQENLDRTLDVAAICSGRLTLTAGTAVTTSDVTGATTVYFTPVRGAKVSLYDGAAWRLFNFSELSVALGTLSSGANYDVFIYNNGGTPALELSAAWSSDTARNQAISLQDGVYVKTATPTRRYLGTFRTTSTTTTEDSAFQRFLWNHYNQVARILYKAEATASWSYATNSWRSANNSSANRVHVLIGIAGPSVDLKVSTAAWSQTAVSSGMSNGIGEDSTNTVHASTMGRYVGANIGTNAVYFNAYSMLQVHPPLGYHYYQWLETALNGALTTAYGTPHSALQCGITGTLSHG